MSYFFTSKRAIITYLVSRSQSFGPPDLQFSHRSVCVTSEAETTTSNLNNFKKRYDYIY